MMDKLLERDLKLYEITQELKKEVRSKRVKGNIAKVNRKIKKDIMSRVDEEIIPFDEFIILLKLLEYNELLKFEAYRYYYCCKDSKIQLFKEGIEFFECQHNQMNVSLRVLFAYFNFDKYENKFLYKEKIKYDEILYPDYQLIFDGIRKYYPNEYAVLVNIIIRYLKTKLEE